MSAIGQEWEEMPDEEWEGSVHWTAEDDPDVVLHRKRIRRALRHNRRKQWAWRIGMWIFGAFVAWELWKIVEVNP